jgi:hypothetical protein
MKGDPYATPDDEELTNLTLRVLGLRRLAGETINTRIVGPAAHQIGNLKARSSRAGSTASAIAALGSVLAAVSSMGGDETGFAPYRVALLVAAAVALIGAMFALRVPDDEAAETMHLQVRPKRSQQSDLQAAEVG